MKADQIGRIAKPAVLQLLEERGGLVSRLRSELPFETCQTIERAHLASVPFRDCMPKRAIADELAENLAASQSERRQAGRALHDEVGPLLTAAGFRLQLLRIDFPDTAERLNEVMQALDDAMQQVRAVSQR